MASYACQSVYMKAFTELYPDLIGNLKSGVFDITDRAYSKFLISVDVKDEITSRSSGKTETERTRILLDAIRDKFSKNTESDVYYQFLEILREDKAFNEVARKLEDKVQAQEEQKGSLYSAIKHVDHNRHLSQEYFILVQKKCQWNRYLQDSETMNKFVSLLKKNGLLTKNQSKRSRKSFEQFFDCMLSLVKKDPSKLRSLTEHLEMVTSQQLESESAAGRKTELADQHTEPNRYHIQARNNVRSKTYWKTLGIVFMVILFFAIVYMFVTKNDITGTDNGFIFPNSTDRVDRGSIDVYKHAVYHNLPRRSSPFFGRENNLTSLTESLLKENRIININGPPAFGKSSLAIKLGWNLIENHSEVFKEVRYIDVSTTRMSIYLCSHHFEGGRATLNPSSKEPNSVE